MGYKTILLLYSRWGYEVFSSYAKLSSSLVPRFKNDRSLTLTRHRFQIFKKVGIKLTVLCF